MESSCKRKSKSEIVVVNGLYHKLFVFFNPVKTTRNKIFALIKLDDKNSKRLNDRYCKCSTKAQLHSFRKLFGDGY